MRLLCWLFMYGHFIIPMQSEGPRPVMVSRSRAGFTLNIIDTPGLVEGGYVNDQALEIIKRFVLSLCGINFVRSQPKDVSPFMSLSFLSM